MQALQVSGDLRYADVDGRVVFLNLASETYLVLDPVASSMWRHVVLLRSPQQIVQSLQQQFAVDAARLERDFANFVQNCVIAGYLVEPVERPIQPPTSHADVHCGSSAFLPLRAWWSLMTVSRSLARLGFTKTYKQFSSSPRAAANSAQSLDLLSRALRGFAWAENFCYLKRAPQDCLPRSLALFAFLRSLGLAVDHVIGVRMFPFAAHAWVEHQGQVLHDNPANSRQFTAIARISA